jgi:hypothetical protein
VEDKWVKNVSDRNLSEVEKRILTRGLNFAITPKRLPIAEYITAVETGIHHAKLPTSEAEDLRRSVATALKNTKLSKPNISKEEREALHCLKEDNTITILPADKGRCTVILNKNDYVTKIQDLLNDQRTYEKLKRDPTSKFKDNIIKVLKEIERSGTMDRRLYLKLYPTSETPPVLYGLPKIHKATIPLRPIVSSIGSITYELAKYLAHIIGPLAGKTPHHIHNSGDFVSKIKDIKLSPEDTIVSYDVTALFTCIPPEDALVVAKDYLGKDNNLRERTPLSPFQLIQLLRLCLETTYFLCMGDYYKQIHGCAMGSPVSPIVVNLYMEKFERTALDTYQGTCPSHWYCYVDDTWVVLRKEETDQFFQHINSIDSNIKFTQEVIQDNQLPFLDCLVKCQPDNSLITTVYRKQTHTDQYLLFSSHHPLNQKLGVVRTLFHRASSIISTEEDKNKETAHLKSALGKCGYQQWTFQTALKKRSDQPVPAINPNPSQRTSVNVTLPYVKNVAEDVRRHLKKYNISASFKPAETLRRHLVHPKDKIPAARKSGVIYHITCPQTDCHDSYIGETSQPLRKRFYQHRRPSTGQESAVYQHTLDTGHIFGEKDIKVLDSEKRWFERGVKEAIYERARRPRLNRRGGLRFLLSRTWDHNINNSMSHVFSHEGGNSANNTSSVA